MSTGDGQVPPLDNHREGLTIAEAAAQLGVSQKTVRRWIKAGRLPATIQDGPYGPQYRVSTHDVHTTQHVVDVVKVEQVFGEGDRVALRWSAHGVHTGDSKGIPSTRVVKPTGREISFSATDIYRIADGRIAEEWNTFDGYDVLRQMGALKVLDGTQG